MLKNADSCALMMEHRTRLKSECIYRLLVRDNVITPLASDKEDGPNIKHKLVLWIHKQFYNTTIHCFELIVSIHDDLTQKKRQSALFL